jgi:hypothetical protein
MPSVSSRVKRRRRRRMAQSRKFSLERKIEDAVVRGDVAFTGWLPLAAPSGSTRVTFSTELHGLEVAAAIREVRKIHPGDVNHVVQGMRRQEHVSIWGSGSG